MHGFRAWWIALLVLGSATLFEAPALADERTDARREFWAGMKLVSEGRYAEGIAHLTQAYETLPHPNVLYNIALAHLYAEQPAQALATLERYTETASESEQREVAPLIGSLRKTLAVPEAPVASAPPLAQQPSVPPAAGAEEALSASKAQVSAQDRLLVAPPASEAIQRAQSGVYDEKVESASRFSQSPLDAPNATATITAQDIRLTGLTDVGQLLRRVAGVEVTSVSPNHAEVSIRGLNRRTSNKVLLLLDGRSLRQDFLGSAWYNFLPISIEDIERIEVIRGPASALYGADAFSGIVNIITRAPGEGGSFVAAGAGNFDQARGVASFNGRGGKLSYHFGAGYSQADNAVTPVGKNRVDHVSFTDTPDRASQKVWSNAEVRYDLAPKSQLIAGGNIVYGDQIVQGLSRLLQVTVDDVSESQLYGSVTTPVGLRLSTFWNRFDGDAGTSYVTPGAVSPAARGVLQNINDVDLSWSRSFKLVVPQAFTFGVGYRYKAIQLSWLDADHTQHHVGAYLQHVTELAKPLRLQLGARVDRHPLLESLQFSPRGSLVYRILPGQSVRATVGQAFRGPSFVESYLEFPNASPVRGVTAWGVGNDGLAPESITSFELGYTTHASESFTLELNGYYNLVKDAILFTQVDRFVLSDVADPSNRLAQYDSEAEAFPVSALRFTNERATFRQFGGELGVRFYPVTGLDVFSNYAIHNTAPTNKKVVDPVRAREQQTSLHKINAGVQYRASFGLDVSCDMSWASKQRWIEQVTDSNTGVRFATYDVPSMLLVNGRLGQRVFDDSLELGVVGTNLAFNRQRQHPFGQPMDTRVMAQAKLRF